jgi:undecaprenyl-diphosphatase
VEGAVALAMTGSIAVSYNGAVDTIIILSAKYLIVISIGLALWALYRAPSDVRVRRALIILCSLALTYLLGKIASYFFFDPRPFVVAHVSALIEHAADNGFPSDHMLLAGGLAAAIWYFNRRIATLLWAVAFAIGVARVLALVHHPIDIIGSVLIALIAAYSVEKIAARIAPAHGNAEGFETIQ